MARAPVPGRAKTRLIPRLGRRGAARLQRRLLLDRVKSLADAGLAPLSLSCSPGRGHPVFRKCHRAWHVALEVQQGRDLGLRMREALRKALATADYAILIGADCAGLTLADIRQALQALEQGVPVVLVPAEDGGYVLIGLRRDCAAIFTGIQWGGDNVMAQTRCRLRRQGLDWLELPTRWDVDRPADLKRLRGTGAMPLWHG